MVSLWNVILGSVRLTGILLKMEANGAEVLTPIISKPCIMKCHYDILIIINVIIIHLETFVQH